MTLSRPPVSACLIVRDAADRVAACVEALGAFVDEVVVADTGSVDGTIGRARDAGARVVRVPWRDDFAAARNAAASACLYDWVLSVDADELPTGDPDWLRHALATLDPAVPALTLHIEELGASNPRGTTAHRAVKLYRRSRCRWQGRVHEQVTLSFGPLAGLRLTAPELPAEALTLRHDGYADPAVFATKISRNLRLALLEVADLTGRPVPDERWVNALLDLGRTQLAAGVREDGVHTLERLRAAATPGTSAWLWATDFLAWDALTQGDAERSWALAADLADQGAEGHLRPLASHLLAGVPEPERSTPAI